MRFSSILVVASASLAVARPNRFIRRQDFKLKNGQHAITLNDKFEGLSGNSPCTVGEFACVDNGFAQCKGDGKFLVQPCPGGTVCAALPLMDAPGISIGCTSAADRDARIAATGAKSGRDDGASSTAAVPSVLASVGRAVTHPAEGRDPQKSLTLDRAVIAPNFAKDGQDQPTEGQVPSLTSSNNFINYCRTVDLPLTNGEQVAGGSCNPAPMGTIAGKARMPTCKFVFPANGATVEAGKPFRIQMAIENLETGQFVNPNSNYLAAPQQLNSQGIIRGHSHVVIQRLQSLGQTTPLDPEKFDFFKGMNGAAVNGILTADVGGEGLPAGFYRLSSVNSAANHQPVLVAVAQRGALDDAVYFTVA